ncbi:MAG: hypothetical protein JWO13_1668 [Acidobacteriales bacterium]|nr:hypothetical protein [Terriglobales bacterium]
MEIRPSIVIGLGSTGKHVVNILQKYMSEVLNTESLDIFRFLILETDMTSTDEDVLSGDTQVKPINIHVQNTGQAFTAMKSTLKEDFSWCPQDLQIGGLTGAGNKRAGGRFMFLYKYSDIEEVLKSAITEVKVAANSPATSIKLRSLLEKRHAPVGDSVISQPNQVIVYVVGSLAGGTCSGACIDLGYLIQRLEPGAVRNAIFFIPDDSANVPFKANTWAAIKDLEFFCKNPAAYEVSWRTNAGFKQTYSTLNQQSAPYQRVYLLSQRDQNGNLHLEFKTSPSSPLLMMAGLQLAADLLGMFAHRDSRLVNLNAQIGHDPVHNMFLNYNLRAVSYPKYEIAEGASCKAIAEIICEGWLDPEGYMEGTTRQPLERENAEKRGREAWREISANHWPGLRADVDIDTFIDQLTKGHTDKPGQSIRTQFADDVPGTIYRFVQQHVAERQRFIRVAITRRFVSEMAKKRSLAAGESFIKGICDEVDSMCGYWKKLGIPERSDKQAWTVNVQQSLERISQRRTGFNVTTAFLKRESLRDELEEVLSKLEMFLMFSAVSEIKKYCQTELHQRVGRIRESLKIVQNQARSRHDAIVAGLANPTGPVLKISRSQQIKFAAEIAELSTRPIELDDSFFLASDEEGHLTGSFAIPIDQRSNQAIKLFSDLRSKLQPQMLIAVEQHGPVNIVREITEQGMIPATAQRANVAHQLSISVLGALAVEPNAVPSYVLAKDEISAMSILTECNARQQHIPPYQTKALPLFDHMAIFHQEGARLSPDDLRHAQDFATALEAAFTQPNGRDITDPYHLIKARLGLRANV